MSDLTKLYECDNNTTRFKETQLVSNKKNILPGKSDKLQIRSFSGDNKVIKFVSSENKYTYNKDSYEKNIPSDKSNKPKLSLETIKDILFK